MAERFYLPTTADLIDRLSIVILKSVFIPENRAVYLSEAKNIMHDLDIVLSGVGKTTELIRAAMVVMLANRYIWENEAKARLGGDEQDKLLKLTHSVNGVRNTAKNVIAGICNERVDLRIDCFAAGLGEYGNWDIFGETA